MPTTADDEIVPSKTGDQHRPLDILMTQVATDLMDVSGVDSIEAMNRVLDRLVEHFKVDDTFLRKHREDRVSELVTIRPERDRLAGVDMLQEMSFDDDPAVAMTEHLTEPVVIYPEHSEHIQEKVKSDLGIEQSSFAVVPLLHENRTVGVLSLVRFSDQRWSDEEVRTLFAIATLMAQFWSRLEAERRLAHQAHYDDLTGLANRYRLLQLVAESQDSAPAMSLLTIDIDNMKAINDGLGLDLGDRYLVGFADRLVEKVRNDDYVARISGDQFAVLTINEKTTETEELAQRLVDDLRQSVNLGEVKIARSVSIGVAHWDSSESGQNLFAEADAALHLAKRQGRNNHRVFDSEMRIRTLRKFEQEIELRQAIENQEFLLHYQPALDMRERSVFAVEALLRWNHPTKGLISAGAFIDTAEESGLIVEIGDVVLTEAMAQLSRWQTRYPDLEMWVNVSPAQLMSRNVPKQVADLAREHAVNLDRLCLEVTEHAMLEDLQTVTGALDQLRAMGVRLALDDFGTGYSSMKQLKNLPVDLLKIDMSFVAGLGKSDHDDAIVDAAITLAEAFGLDTVAEGVETDEQVEELLARGCSQAQGFLLAKPQDSDSITTLLETNESKATQT